MLMVGQSLQTERIVAGFVMYCIGTTQCQPSTQLKYFENLERHVRTKKKKISDMVVLQRTCCNLCWKQYDCTCKQSRETVLKYTSPANYRTILAVGRNFLTIKMTSNYNGSASKASALFLNTILRILFKLSKNGFRKGNNIDKHNHIKVTM